MRIFLGFSNRTNTKYYLQIGFLHKQLLIQSYNEHLQHEY